MRTREQEEEEKEMTTTEKQASKQVRCWQAKCCAGKQVRCSFRFTSLSASLFLLFFFFFCRFEELLTAVETGKEA